MRNLDKSYMDIAVIWSKNSYAIRNKVGAIIVKDGQIISDGYNGTPNGFDNCCEDIIPCEHSCTNLFSNNCETCSEHRLITKPYVLHAEANAITKLAKSTNSAVGATLYITLSPCYECAKLIIQAGITTVVYKDKYRDESGIELLKQAGIRVCKL